MAWYAGRSTVCKCGDVVAGYNFEDKGEGTVLLRFLGKSPLHNTCYTRPLGKVVVLAVLCGWLAAWYFTRRSAYFSGVYENHPEGLLVDREW